MWKSYKAKQITAPINPAQIARRLGKLIILMDKMKIWCIITLECT